MNDDTCRYERDVLVAAEEDRWTDALRMHAAECPDCAAAASVAPWMDRFAKISDREHILPDPSIVWLKAQLLRGAADVARASRPMNVFQLVAYLVVAGGWAALLTWKWEAVQQWIDEFSPVDAVTGAAALSLPMFAAVLVLGTLTVSLALHTILAEE